MRPGVVLSARHAAHLRVGKGACPGSNPARAVLVITWIE
jgi:hypothetical protein